MLKVIGFFLVFYVSCTIGSSPTGSGNVVYDKNLQDPFFEAPQYFSGEFVDSIFVPEIDKSNARIHGRNLYPLDSCKCIREQNGSVIEIKSTDIYTHKLKLHILNNHFTADLIRNDIGVHYQWEAKPIKLILRDRPLKKGQKIFGKLEVEAYDSVRNKQIIFRGPFLCDLQ